MYFKPYYLGCLSHASYLVAGTNGEAAVIDPRRDVEEYLTDAEAAGLKIKHVIETHLHADFVSGHMELARRTGATIYLGAGSGATFPHQPVQDGDKISLGNLTLTFRTTPGHTPEGVCVLAQESDALGPQQIFTGDTLFIGDVGRPDLVGSKGYTAEQMAQMLYASLRDKILPLPDSIEIWPAHGAGSACGKALSDERVSTLGRQKEQNIALRYVVDGDETGFIRYATEGLDSAPTYFAHDARKNKEGARTLEEILTAASPLAPATVEAYVEDGLLVLDTRSSADFGTGHVPGALHIPLEGRFAPWVGTVIAPESLLIVVTEPEKETEAITRLARIGYENILGWLEGGMAAWQAAGGEVQSVPQLAAAELHHRLTAEEGLSVLDVRSDAEWEAGHIANAQHIPLPELTARLSEVSAEGPIAVLCGSGYRSSIATSLLQRAGHRNILNVVGGWSSYISAS